MAWSKMGMIFIRQFNNSRGFLQKMLEMCIKRQSFKDSKNVRRTGKLIHGFINNKIIASTGFVNWTNGIYVTGLAAPARMKNTHQFLDIVVADGHKNKGIGSQIFDELCRVITEEEYKHLVIIGATFGVQPFYEKVLTRNPFIDSFYRQKIEGLNAFMYTAKLN